MNDQLSQSLCAAVQADADERPVGAYRITDFWNSVYNWAVKNINPKDFIDTPEERKQLEDAVLVALRHTVFKNLPPALQVLAEATVTSALDALLLYLVSVS